MEDSSLIEDLKTISIRGRMAFAIQCIDNYIHFKNINNFEAELTLVIDKLKEFLTSNTLDVWDEQVRDLLPSSILDNHPQNNLEDYEYVDFEIAKKLEEAYRSLPIDLINIIDYSAAIGSNNLYECIVGFSSKTLTPLLNIIKVLRASNIELPEIDKYLDYKFIKEEGWGEIILV